MLDTEQSIGPVRQTRERGSKYGEAETHTKHFAQVSVLIEGSRSAAVVIRQTIDQFS
ncbi:hypothetical protein AB0M44_38320 [Streptosporangium subroseum]|uniref:hypothetical protein n=1 Tax=Streptosporangium subroseum TaxID=106412 RepID=UPI00341F0085